MLAGPFAGGEHDLTEPALHIVDRVDLVAVTGPASQFLHCQVQGDDWKHPHVLRGSLDLIRILEETKFESAGRAMLT